MELGYLYKDCAVRVRRVRVRNRVRVRVRNRVRNRVRVKRVRVGEG